MIDLGTLIRDWISLNIVVIALWVLVVETRRLRRNGRRR